MTDASGTANRITGICSMAMRHVLAELTEAYGRQTGQMIEFVAVGGVDAARRVGDGEAFDLVVLASDAIAKLASAGRVLADSRVDLARSGVAMAVAAGTPPPDVSTELTVRNAVLHARSIGYSTGPSGTHLLRLFERWGIADAMASRIVQAPPGIPVGTLVARGDVALGFQQLSELLNLPGIHVIGPLPPEIQVVTIFSGAVCTPSSRPEAARELLAHLASPIGDSVKRSHGMEPG